MKNYAKKFLVVLLALLPCFQTSVMAGEGDEPEAIPVKPKPTPSPPGPRSRARYIEEVPACYYYEGEVSIQAENGIAGIVASVTRLEDNATWTGAGTSNTLIMSVPEDAGTYILRFTLSDGKSYIGEYHLY